ncbi:hypothetical protein HanPSC8_Chr08g0337731 [Helianthus annuus]|nr:hypothetical protein HanPSC8_Chr08g0337731 [Helianthus annuus]
MKKHILPRFPFVRELKQKTMILDFGAHVADIANTLKLTISTLTIG